MDTQAILRDLGERLGAGASARTVYGEAITSGDRTVVPVARVRYAFGAGGGGGGGGLRAWPAGALEVTPRGTRFVGFHDGRIVALAAGAGFVLGAAMAFAGSGGLWASVLLRRRSAQNRPADR